MILTILRFSLSFSPHSSVFWSVRLLPNFQDTLSFAVSCDFFMHLSNMHCDGIWISRTSYACSSGCFNLSPLLNMLWKTIDCSFSFRFYNYSIHFGFYILSASWIIFIRPINFLMNFAIISPSFSFFLSLILILFLSYIIFWVENFCWLTFCLSLFWRSSLAWMAKACLHSGLPGVCL